MTISPDAAVVTVSVSVPKVSADTTVTAEVARAQAVMWAPKIVMNAVQLIATYEVDAVFDIDEDVQGIFDVDETVEAVFNVLIEMGVTWGMSADHKDYELWRGETRKLNVTVSNPDKTVKPLNGASVDWYMLRSEDDDDSQALIHKSDADGSATLDPENGKFTVRLAPSDTSGRKIGQYFHRGAVTDNSGDRCVVFTGTIKLK